MKLLISLSNRTLHERISWLEDIAQGRERIPNSEASCYAGSMYYFKNRRRPDLHFALLSHEGSNDPSHMIVLDEQKKFILFDTYEDKRVEDRFNPTALTYRFGSLDRRHVVHIAKFKTLGKIS